MNAIVENEDDEVSTRELILRLRVFLSAVRDDRSAFLKVVGIAMIFGMFIAFGSPVEFSATMRLLPYRSGANGNNLSGLAGLAGIRLPAGTGDQTITADLYPEVVKSLDFLVPLAETPLTFHSINPKVSSVEYFRHFKKHSLTEIVSSYTTQLPSRIFSQSQSNVEPHSSKENGGSERIVSIDPEYLTLVNGIGERLAISIDRKTSILTIRATMPDSYAAADLVRVASDRLMQQVIAYETKKAGEQFAFVSKQHQQAMGRYSRAQRDLASFADRNRALMSAMSQIEQDRLRREHDLAFELYQQLSRELEQARIKMNQDSPVFTVLEQVVVPNDHSSPNRFRILVYSLFIGILLAFVRVAVKMNFFPATTEPDQSYAS